MRKRNRDLTWRLLTCAVFFVQHFAAAGSSPLAQDAGRQPRDGRYYESLARAAHKAKGYASFLANIPRAAEPRTNHPRITYNVAVAYARSASGLLRP